MEKTLRLTPGREVSGQVVDYRGDPVAGASVFSVRLVPINIHGGSARNAVGDHDPSTVARTTDADGRFTGLRLSALNRIAVSSQEVDAWPVIVQDGQSDVLIQLPEPATLEINYDIPGADAETEVYLQYLTPFMNGGDAWKNVHPEREFSIPQGRSVFPTLTPGHYTLTISAQKPVSAARLQFSSPIFPDFQHHIDVTIPPDQSEVILDDISLPIR